MSRRQEILRQVAILSTIGLGLFGIAIFAPDTGPHRGAFFEVARQSTWRNLWDLPAAWASVKIILLSIGLFLLIESTGTVLTVMKMRSLALLVFFLQVMPFLGLMWGGYYLVKSLL